MAVGPFSQAQHHRNHVWLFHRHDRLLQHEVRRTSDWIHPFVICLDRNLSKPHEFHRFHAGIGRLICRSGYLKAGVVFWDARMEAKSLLETCTRRRPIPRSVVVTAHACWLHEGFSLLLCIRVEFAASLRQGPATLGNPADVTAVPPARIMFDIWSQDPQRPGLGSQIPAAGCAADEQRTAGNPRSQETAASLSDAAALDHEPAAKYYQIAAKFCSAGVATAGVA